MNPPDKQSDETKLVQPIPELREALLEEMARFADLFHAKSADEHSLVGRVAYCHLIVEHYLVKHVESLLPGVGDIAKLRLNFQNLLTLARGMTHPHATVGIVFREIEALTEIRNTLAHRLKANLTQHPKLKVLSDFLCLIGAKKTDTLNDPVRIIESATLFIVIFLSMGPIFKGHMDEIERKQRDAEMEMHEALLALQKDILGEDEDEPPSPSDG